MAEAAKKEKAAKPTEPVTLRAIDAKLRAISDTLVENGGDITEVEAELDALEGDRDRKLEGIAIVRRNMLAHASTATAHRDYYAGIASSFETAAERLKNYAHGVMRFGAFPIVKIKTGLVSAWRQRNSRPSFECPDPERLPARFRVDPQPQRPRLNDAAALEAWSTEFDRIVDERTALMSKDERSAWLLANLQAIADEACRAALPEGVRCTLDEHLRM